MPLDAPGGSALPLRLLCGLGVCSIALSLLVAELIAAHAITSGSILITNNMREFARVPGLDVQDWVPPH